MEQFAVPKIAVPAGQSYFNAASMATAGSRDICWYYQASSQDNRTSRSGLPHWNGAAWHASSLSAAISNVEAMTQDGHGGMWLTADASIEPGR